MSLMQQAIIAISYRANISACKKVNGLIEKQGRTTICANILVDCKQ